MSFRDLYPRLLHIAQEHDVFSSLIREVASETKSSSISRLGTEGLDNYTRSRVENLLRTGTDPQADGSITAEEFVKFMNSRK